MHFMLLILAFLLWAVVWGFFHANPKGVPAVPLLICNVAIIAAALGAGGIVGIALHTDALAQHPDERVLAAYLALMAGCTLFMIVVAVAGLVRNLLLFPLSRRKPV